jgi:hypothetical protein
MFVSKFISALLTVTPVLLILGSGFETSIAQVAPTLQASTPDRKQLEAGFTPPKDSDPGEGLISTSTGTFFRPPRDSRRLSGPVTPGGSRYGGCLGITETAFTAFGPKDTEFIVGQTVSSHPEFVWHLPESAGTFPVIFRLLEPNEADRPIPIFETTLDYTPGFVKYQLPQTEPALSPGINYRWQVIVECNPAYPSRALVQELPFEVVPTTTTLSQALSEATTDTERALAYGREGIWYNAIAQVAQTTTIADQQTRSGLLSDLASSIAPDVDPTLEQLRQDILTIVEATKPAP